MRGDAEQKRKWGSGKKTEKLAGERRKIKKA